MPSRALGERWPHLLSVSGHPAVGMPPHVVKAAAACAVRAPYAPVRGLPRLREAIAHRHGADPHHQVIITQGAMQALYLALRAFGARTVVHAPCFFFPQLVRHLGGRCEVTYDWDEYAAAVTAQTTLAIVNTPVNPTGRVLRADDLEALAAALRDRPALLLSDEAYAGLVYDGLPHLSPADHPELRDRTLVVRSFSKTFGMAAWRVGYAIGPSAVIAALGRGLQWQSMAVDSVAQSAALAALAGPQGWIRQAIGELGRFRPVAVAAAQDAGLPADVPEGCAFLWASVDGDEDRWSETLARDYGIPALPGRHFHARTPHLRIPFGGERRARQQLLERLSSLSP